MSYFDLSPSACLQIKCWVSPSDSPVLIRSASSCFCKLIAGIVHHCFPPKKQKQGGKGQLCKQRVAQEIGLVCLFLLHLYCFIPVSILHVIFLTGCYRGPCCTCVTYGFTPHWICNFICLVGLAPSLTIFISVFCFL